jgi:hypothetical protein
MMTWSNSDKYGEYTVEIHGRILSVTIKGAMGLGLSRKYVNHVVEASEILKGAPWGYYACAIDFDASTYDANKVIISGYRRCIENGCVIDAYRINSPVAKNQLQLIRQSLDAGSSIEDNLFDSEEDAYKFINETLTNARPKLEA